MTSINTEESSSVDLVLLYDAISDHLTNSDIELADYPNIEKHSILWTLTLTKLCSTIEFIQEQQSQDKHLSNEAEYHILQLMQNLKPYTKSLNLELVLQPIPELGDELQTNFNYIIRIVTKLIKQRQYESAASSLLDLLLRKLSWNSKLDYLTIKTMDSLCYVKQYDQVVYLCEKYKLTDFTEISSNYLKQELITNWYYKICVAHMNLHKFQLANSYLRTLVSLAIPIESNLLKNRIRTLVIVNSLILSPNKPLKYAFFKKFKVHFKQLNTLSSIMTAYRNLDVQKLILTLSKKNLILKLNPQLKFEIYFLLIEKLRLVKLLTSLKLLVRIQIDTLKATFDDLISFDIEGTKLDIRPFADFIDSAIQRNLLEGWQLQDDYLVRVPKFSSSIEKSHQLQNELQDLNFKLLDNTRRLSELYKYTEERYLNNE
ncbi:BA75_04661T0 [Komagataella pastoris]|uniref:BA75_04661T0 n=1 Tax=Komagataella pastoris TaxID=4922 RepID=A0A1B2JIY7_PICPA|nr:BA75_04661T0 [Komagataella pastoris]